ncbi:GNAT family N-acetyltransferase [Citrobacter sp. Awk 2]|uniref:GNAT family N-acetyltransferase n=1 Tax=Citrobacter sp. Awk 2 TaxID=2963959 RepID=UPI0023041165|nr:GNAT family N-acetyltransferase [Citrobacter sp. Awk 2]MDA8503970.1 GNAT family N-acetyltransferase [Citrobacter sp. Awk 2]
MKIPKLHTERLLLKPLEAEDASQIQVLYPRWELDPEYQGQGFMREASNVATDYWFNTLNKTVLRAPKASLNIRSKRISDSSGMRLIKTEKKEYVSGLLDSELWEITRDEWNARQVG